MSADYALAIHTSSPDLGLAIHRLDGEEPVRSQVWPLGRDLSHQFHVHLQDFLQPQRWTDLAFIAVAIGPGGFTGTRMGVVTARTLAQQLEIPLFGISSLAAIAQAQVLHSEFLAIEMPAQRGEVFGSIYRLASPRPIWYEAVLSDRVFTPETWHAQLAEYPHPLVHIQAPVSQGQFVEQILHRAEQAWQSGEQPHWSSTLPYYGQHPVQ